VFCAGEEIVYTLRRKRVKNLNLRVRPDGSTVLSVPPTCPVSRADRFVEAKGPFILRAREEFRRRPPPPDLTACVPGQVLCLLGEPLRLQVSRGPISAILRDGTLLLTLPEPEQEEQRRKLLCRFLDDLCRTRFSQIMAAQYTRLRQDCAVAMPQLRIRQMKTRWGSCLPQKGIVTLNRQLIFQPLSCAEYVILHELCHLMVPNHSPGFYALVARYMPDWKERRQILNGREPKN